MMASLESGIQHCEAILVTHCPARRQGIGHVPASNCAIVCVFVCVFVVCCFGVLVVVCLSGLFVCVFGCVFG